MSRVLGGVIGATLALVASLAAAQEEKSLNIYNWSA